MTDTASLIDPRVAPVGCGKPRRGRRGTLLGYGPARDGLRGGRSRLAHLATKALVLAGLAAVALYMLLTQATSLPRTLAAARSANLGLVAVAVGLALLSYAAGAIALIGASPQWVPVGRTYASQLAASFTNRLLPAGVGGLATNVSYLERAGARRAQAIGTVSLIAVAGFLVHAVATIALTAAAGFGTKRPIPSPDLDAHVVACSLLLLTITGLGFWIMRIPKVRAVVRDGIDGIIGITRRPARATMLFGGVAGFTACQVLAFVACVMAFGMHVPVLSLFAIFVTGRAVAAAAPTPGGLGAFEAAVVAGLSHVGAPVAPAVAAVLTTRLVTYWFPVLPGAVAFRCLRRREIL